MNISEDYAHALKHIEAKKQGLVGYYWDRNGKFLHSIRMRYSVAPEGSSMKVANYTTRATLKIDAARFAGSKYALDD